MSVSKLCHLPPTPSWFHIEIVEEISKSSLISMSGHGRFSQFTGQTQPHLPNSYTQSSPWNSAWSKMPSDISVWSVRLCNRLIHRWPVSVVRTWEIWWVSRVGLNQTESHKISNRRLSIGNNPRELRLWLIESCKIYKHSQSSYIAHIRAPYWRVS